MSKNVKCNMCANFINPVLKDENDIFSGIKINAKCKLGKKVMFRKPIYKEDMFAINDAGYNRKCSFYLALNN